MNIAVLDGAILNPGDIDWGPLRALGDLIIYDRTDPDQLAERVKNADIVLVNKTLIRARNIPALGQCKLVGVLATGANNLDLPDLARAGIPVCNVPGYGIGDVAQHALALLMELARNTGLHTQSVKQGDWRTCGEWCYWQKTPLSLSGLTLGIIGFGAIGQAMGAYGHALGMKVLANSRSRKAETSYPFTYASRNDIFRNAHVISLHCPLTDETSQIINANSIRLMRDGAIIINTSRGGLVDEAAAAQALHDGKLGGLGTDVLSCEPPAEDNPLLKAPNTLITPHMAWATATARQNIINIMAGNIKSFLAGQPVNIIND